MASINTSINSLLATNFSDLGRIGQGVNRTFNATHPQTEELRNQLSGLKEGTTISARYDYRVGTNGQLVQTGASVTTRAADEEENQQGRQRSAAKQDERQQSFTDLLKPKAQLAPADEAALFTVQASDDAVSASGQTIVLQGGAEEEDGTAIDVEVYTPGMGENTPANTSLAAQRQQEVSNLYARNYELLFTIDAGIEIAA